MPVPVLGRVETCHTYLTVPRNVACSMLEMMDIDVRASPATAEMILADSESYEHRPDVIMDYLGGELWENGFSTDEAASYVGQLYAMDAADVDAAGVLMFDDPVPGWVPDYDDFGIGPDNLYAPEFDFTFDPHDDDEDDYPYIEELNASGEPLRGELGYKLHVAGTGPDGYRDVLFVLHGTLEDDVAWNAVDDELSTYVLPA